MTERKWLPVEFSDEACPLPLSSPDDFLIKHSDGSYWIIADGDPSSFDDQFWKQQVELGQVVYFLAHESYGDFTVTVPEDKMKRAFADQLYPEKANGFISVDDADDIYESLERFSAEHEPGDYDVSIYWWSEGETPFRLELDHDGKPKFVMCHGAS